MSVIVTEEGDADGIGGSFLIILDHDRRRE